MDPGPLLHPVGPLPAGTYWVRRALTVAVLVVAIVLSARWLSGSGDGSPAKRAGGRPTGPTPALHTTSPQTSPAAAASPPAPPLARPASSDPPLVTCASRSIRVTARTDARSYPAGVRPVLTMTVQNRAGVACTRDLGPGARGLTVRSGPDRIWSSNDCEGSGTTLVTLAPGETRSYAVRWSRLRSHPGCPTPGAPGRPGTYRLYATLDGITSAPAVFSLR